MTKKGSSGMTKILVMESGRKDCLRALTEYRLGAYTEIDGRGAARTGRVWLGAL
jgi:hypothetical protein